MNKRKTPLPEHQACLGCAIASSVIVVLVYVVAVIATIILR